MTFASDDRAQLRAFLIKQFSLSELKDLVFDLGFEIDGFPQEQKNDFARELIRHCERIGKIPCLVKAMLTVREDDFLSKLLSKLPSCSPSTKVQIYVSQELIERQDIDELIADISTRLNVPASQITLIGAAWGSTYFLISVSGLQLAFNISQEFAFYNSKRRRIVYRMKLFGDLLSNQKATWRIIAQNHPPARTATRITPSISFGSISGRITRRNRTLSLRRDPRNETVTMHNFSGSAIAIVLILFIVVLIVGGGESQQNLGGITILGVVIAVLLWLVPRTTRLISGPTRVMRPRDVIRPYSTPKTTIPRKDIAKQKSVVAQIKVVKTSSFPQQREWNVALPCTIGRSIAGVDIVTIKGDPFISPRHLEVVYKGNKVYISDLGSLNGTFINGKRIEKFKPVLLPKGAVIRLGRNTEVTISTNTPHMSSKKGTRR